MATRHELIHIDFVANAGKANPVLKSLKDSCEEARVAKEALDEQLASAKAANAPAEVIAKINDQLKDQTKIYTALQKGVREYTKGIDTLSKGIKEFNEGTLDEMSAKFNKSVYNAAKLAQSSVKTGSKDWTELQRLMDATDRNVVRAREDIVAMMQSLKDGSSVSVAQLTRAKEVLQDLASLAVVNSEEWRGLKDQMNQVGAAVNTVADTEKRLKGEITTVDDAMALSNNLTKEAIALRREQGEASMQAAKKEREGIEGTMKDIQNRMVLKNKERQELKDELALQESYDEIVKKREKKISDATSRMNEAQQRRDEAEATINAYETQKIKLGKLKEEIKDLEREERQEAKTKKDAADAAEAGNKVVDKQQQKVDGLKNSVSDLETQIRKLDGEMTTLDKQPAKSKAATKEETAATEELTEATEKNTRSKKKNNEAKQKAVELSEKELKQYREKVGKIQDELEDLRAEQIDKENDIRYLEREAEGYKKVAKSIEAVREAFKKVQGAETLHVTDDVLTTKNTMKRSTVEGDNDTFQRSVQYMQQTLKGFSSDDIKERFKGYDDYLKELKFNLGQINSALDQADRQLRKGGTVPEDEMRSRIKVLEELKKSYFELTKVVEANGKAYFEMGDKADSSELKEKQAELKVTKDNIAAKEKELGVIMKALGIQTEETAAIGKETEAQEKNNKSKKESIRLTKKQKEEVELLETAIKGQSAEIEKLKKQRDALNASGSKMTGVTASTPEEAKAALDAIKERTKIKVSTKGDATFTNIEEAQNFLQNMIKKANPLAVATDGALQLTNKNQVDKVIGQFQEAYGLQGERKEAINIIKQLISGDKGGLFTSGTMDDKSLRIIPDQTAISTRLETMKQLLAIQKGATQATEESTKAGKENIDVEKQKKDLDEKIAQLEKDKAANQTKVNEIKEQGTAATKKSTKAKKEETKATEEQVKVEEQSMSVEDQKAALLAKKAKLADDLRKKQEELTKAQSDLAEMTKKTVTEEEKESEVTSKLAAKRQEYEEEQGKLGDMKTAAAEARKDRTRANNAITRATETISTTQNEAMPERKSEAEVEKMRKRVNELTGDVENLTKAYDENAEAIARLNKQETDAAIEMAQSENVSIEKVKQAIAVLEKKIQTEATDEQTMQARGEAINRLKDRLTEMNAEVARLSQPIAEKLSGDLGKLSEAEIRQGIDAAKELVKTYETASPEAQKLTENIARAEQHLRDHSVEAARQAQKEKDQLDLMTTRMDSLGNLSNAALTETKRFWQAMADGADKNDPKLKEIEERLKAINAEEQKRNTEAVREQAGKIKAGEYTAMDENQLRSAIDAAREFQKTLTVGSTEYNEYSEAIAKADEHMRKYGVETERAKLKQEELNSIMRQQLDQGSNLSESALKQQEQYWQRLIDDPKTAAESLEVFKANLKEVKDLQDQMAATNNAQKAQIVQTGTLGNYSEGEIRESINAAKELLLHMASGSAEAKNMSEAIARAESHIEKYGVAAARTAQKQRESNDQMRKQLSLIQEDLIQRQVMPSESVLKAQHSYWQKLIEDPKNAGKSLQEYRDRLAEVEKLQETMVDVKGQTAFQWFQNGSDKIASTNKVKEMTDNLKAWRDTLGSQDHRLEAIDAFLQKVGKSAKSAAEDVMSLEDALKIAEQAGEQYYLKNSKENFIASPQQIQAATKALNERRDAVIKEIKAERDLGHATDEQEKELADLTKKLKDLKFEQDNLNMSQEKMQMLMKQPTSAVSLEELRAAIKRADGELKRMQGSLGENSKEYQHFAKQVKEAKFVLKDMEGQAKATAGIFDKAWARLRTYVGMYMGFNMLWSKVTGTMGDLMTLSDKMGEVRKTTGFTADEVGRLSDNLAKLDTRTNLTGLMEFSSLAGSVGLKTQEAVQGFTEAANMIAVSLPEMGNEASRTLIKIAQATGDLEKNGGDVRETLEKVGSTIIALRANSAAAAGPITDFVSRVGAVGAQAGISIDQIAALGATVDALGGRVEMSATALSRMIPAIKNNTFAVAKAIGVLESDLKGMSGMEQIVTIFRKLHDSVKDFNTDTDEGMNAMADKVEQMLGNSASMQDVMKQLNQQGARAGIVFGLLSQNVDMLEKQLGTAGEAYEKNTALMDEYNKMNETTAAKWERLKNTIEELIVNDSVQHGLGNIIDMLRFLVDLMTGKLSPALRSLTVLVHTFATYWAVMRIGLGEAIFVKAAEGFKNLGTGFTNLIDKTKSYIIYSRQLSVAQNQLKAATDGVSVALAKNRIATIEAEMAQKGLNKAMLANVWMAVAAAIGMFVVAMYNYIDSLHEEAKEAAKFQAQLDQEQQKVKDLTNAIGENRVKTEENNKTLAEAQKKLEDAKKATDGTRESSEKLKKAEEELTKAEREKGKLMSEHKRLISEFNTQYSKYLGFMLSEVSSNLELARARELVNDKLRETIALKRKEASLERIEKEYGEDRDDAYSSLYDAIHFTARTGAFGAGVQDPVKAAKVLNEITKAAQNEKLSREQFQKTVEKILNENKVGMRGTSNMEKALDYYDEVVKIREKTRKVEQQFAGEEKANREQSQKDLEKQYIAATGTYNDLSRDYVNATGEARKKAAAAMLKQMDSINEMVDNSQNYFDMTDKGERNSYNTFIKNSDARVKGMNEQREKLLKEAGDAYSPRDKVGGGTTTGDPTGGSNPYGNYNKVTDDYSKWNGNDLVARRKEMLERVRALANGADVQAVLSEDAKFISDAVKKNIKTTEQAIEWYNTERLKIQEALHAKHLTNTGDWQDPKKGAAKRTSQLVQDEMKYYLDELDAYYTERKARIEEARNNEEITEGEAWRRNLKNENEWYQKRAELQLLYTEKSVNVSEEEKNRIFEILSERTGDTVKFIKQDIASVFNLIKKVGSEKSIEAMKKIFGDLELNAEKSFVKSHQALGKQLKFIEDTLAKERPYDGITKNLQDNLDKMGVLAARMRRINDELTAQGKEQKYSNEDVTAQSYKELAFYLKNAEDAYRIDINELLRRMAQDGMAATADEISKSDMLKQAVMGQLRNVYQQVQDSIKKEAGQIKKDVEILWNDDTLGPDGKSLKSNFDKIIAQLTQQQEAVSRANSLIGAGTASENVATRVAMKQIEMQMRMQEAQFNMFRIQAAQRIKALKDEAAEHERIAEKMKQEGDYAKEAEERTKAANALRDAENVRRSLGLTLAEETKQKEAQMTELLKKQEEIQARLYKSLQEWAETLTSGLKGVMEAANFYNSSDYNQLAVTRAGGSYNRKVTQTTSVSNSSKTTDTAKHSTSTSAQSTSTKTNKTDTSSSSQASKTSKSDTNKDQSTAKHQTSDTHTTTSTSQTKNTTTTTETIQNYYIIENAGTKDAVAREVEMTEEEYYEKKIELDRDNAIKDAWKALLDDLNMKMSDMITDQMNAMFQDIAINQNTDATNANTQALQGLTAALGGISETRNLKPETDSWARDAQGMALDESGNIVYPIQPTEGETETPALGTRVPTPDDWAQAAEGSQMYWNSQVEQIIGANEALTDAGVQPFGPQLLNEDQVQQVIDNNATITEAMTEQTISAGQAIKDAGVQPLTPKMLSEEEMQAFSEQQAQLTEIQTNAQNQVAANKVKTDKQMAKSETTTDTQMTQSANSMYAKMMQAANLYGIAYQAMSNDNLNTAQKFEMIAVQAAGQAAIAALTASMSQNTAQVAADTPAVASKTFAQLGPIAGPAAFAAITALLGGLLGVAVSKITRSKQEIAQATGASASATNVSAGKLMTGMLTYAEGNVNEFTDPRSLTEGRMYNVDGADGRTYRAKYMGKDARTHITNGPEFHLVGERGREAIIDANTTRMIQMNEPQIWQAIQTIYNGGTLRHGIMRRKGRGMAAFADGNMDDFETADGGGLMAEGLSAEQLLAFQASIDRQNELLADLRENGIEAFVSPYGPRGIVNGYDTAKKEALSHGERYL